MPRAPLSGMLMPLNWLHREVQFGQLMGQASQIRRYPPHQPKFLSSKQPCQVWRTVGQIRRYLPAQLVLVQFQPFQVWSGCPDSGRYLSAQLVMGEPQDRQVSQVAQLRDGTYPRSTGYKWRVSSSKIGQVAQLRRYLPAQGGCYQDAAVSVKVRISPTPAPISPLNSFPPKCRDLQAGQVA